VLFEVISTAKCPMRGLEDKYEGSGVWGSLKIVEQAHTNHEYGKEGSIGGGMTMCLVRLP
jgi:hypothetical protein